MAETWDQLEDWEEWTPESGTSFRVHAVAGSLAGAAEHCVIFPVDTMRTHMQAEGAGGRNAVANLVAREGYGRLWRGVSTMLTATIPAHAIYFSVFEKSKIALGADNEEHTPIAAAACGAIATLGHDAIMTPADVLKQRMQLGLHHGLTDAARTVVRNEGYAALFRSLPTTLLMNMPFASIMVAANESFKKVLNPSNEYNVKAFFVSGGLAGAVAAAATTPLDVIKTRLQTQSVLLELQQQHQAHASAKSSGSSLKATSRGVSRGVGSSGVFGLGLGGRSIAQPAAGFGLAPFYSRACKYKNSPGTPPSGSVSVKGTWTLPSAGSVTNVRSIHSDQIRYKGFLDTAFKIYQAEGVQGFTRGVKPRVMVFAPSVAISWTTYETAKTLLTPHL